MPKLKTGEVQECGNCRFKGCLPYSSQLVCRYNPPVNFTVRDYNRAAGHYFDNLKSRFPITWEDDWCRMWEESEWADESEGENE